MKLELLPEVGDIWMIEGRDLRDHRYNHKFYIDLIDGNLDRGFIIYGLYLVNNLLKSTYHQPSEFKELLFKDTSGLSVTRLKEVLNDNKTP